MHKGSHHNFTMFFQLELVKIAQTPHPPPLSWLWKQSRAGPYMVVHCTGMGVTLKWLSFSHFWNYTGSTPRVNFLSYCCCVFLSAFMKNLDCDLCFFYLDGVLPPSPPSWRVQVEKTMWNFYAIPNFKIKWLKMCNFLFLANFYCWLNKT